MNKVVVIGVIIAAVIIVGAIVLGQDNESEVTDTTEVTDTIEVTDTTEVTDIENDQTEPKEFSVDLQESVGMTEKP